ncbi:MAG: endolytic transglycosylase MltG [Dehalococcoidia bacterium]|nr:endolytic transglycosylase MltG [Dehalococcoidia bacterium]
MMPMLRWLFSGRSMLMALGFALVAASVIVASALFADTPNATLGADVIPTPAPAPSGGAQRFILAEGSTLDEVADELEDLGIVRSSQQFKILASLLGLQNRLVSGVYTLRPGDSTISILRTITVVDVDRPTVTVTFPEGLRIEEMAEIVQQAGFGPAEEFITAARAAELPLSLAVALPDEPGAGLYLYPEGYLFPDTYFVPIGSTAAELVALMAETMHLRFSADLREAAARRGLTPHEVLTLASMIEREVVIPEERAVVAGVLFNRIEAFDRLGIDATTQYCVATLDPDSVEAYGWWKPGSELTPADLDCDSPYNTRRYVGLPPGPIASPGLASIEAVVYAEDTHYYYYRIDARNDDGSHCFAVTFEEHDDPNRCEKADR